VKPPRASRPVIIGAIIARDLIEFSRDRLWMILTPLSLVMFGVLFWVLPATVDETITAGIHPPELAAVLEGVGRGAAVGGEALRVIPFASPDHLAAAVAGERATTFEGRTVQVRIGLAFPEDFLTRTRAGETTTVRVYVHAAVPIEVQRAIASAVREIAFLLAGAPAPVRLPAADLTLVGQDLAGAQVPLRERMRPLLAFFVLITESLVLASLIASEVASRTFTAVMATPARTSDIISAKGLFGTLLAFGQAVILLLITQSFGANAPVLLAAVLLGAMLVAAVGMVTGAAGKDFMGTLFYGMIFLVVLLVPAIANLFPGTASPLVTLLPSYGVVQAITGAATYGQGFAEVAGYLAMAGGWVAVLLVVAWSVLERKLRSL